MRHMTSVIARQRRSSEDGQSLMEFAFLLPVLVLLTVGVCELGRAAAYTIAVKNAATAGAEFGSQSQVNAVNIPAMESQAINDVNYPQFSYGMLTATATYGCLCDDGTGKSCPNPVPAPTTCTPAYLTCDQGPIVQCVQVNTTGTWNSLLNYPGIPNMYQANGQTIMRVQR